MRDEALAAVSAERDQLAALVRQQQGAARAAAARQQDAAGQLQVGPGARCWAQARAPCRRCTRSAAPSPRRPPPPPAGARPAAGLPLDLPARLPPRRAAPAGTPGRPPQPQRQPPGPRWPCASRLCGCRAHPAAGPGPGLGRARLPQGALRRRVGPQGGGVQAAARAAHAPGRGLAARRAAAAADRGAARLPGAAGGLQGCRGGGLARCRAGDVVQRCLARCRLLPRPSIASGRTSLHPVPLLPPDRALNPCRPATPGCSSPRRTRMPLPAARRSGCRSCARARRRWTARCSSSGRSRRAWPPAGRGRTLRWLRRARSWTLPGRPWRSPLPAARAAATRAWARRCSRWWASCVQPGTSWPRLRSSSGGLLPKGVGVRVGGGA
jgi:hypothetical protein